VKRPASAALLAALALAGCGGEARDLFLVTRSGDVPGARLTLRITDDGRASCNRRPLVGIASAQLIDSPRQPHVLFKLAKLTRDVAKGPCRLPR
jgi:hypothetical protein